MQNRKFPAVMFRGHNARLKFRPENGMEVLVQAKISVYEPRGAISFIASIWSLLVLAHCSWHLSS